MNQFNIVFDFYKKDELIKRLKKNPRNVSNKLYGYISIEFNGKLQIPPWAKSQNFTDTDWLLPFFASLAEQASTLKNGETKKIMFLDDPLYLELVRTKDNVLIKLTTHSGQLIGKTKINYQIFLSRVLKIITKFIEEVRDINKQILKNKEFEGIKKYKKILKKIEAHEK